MIKKRSLRIIPLLLSGIVSAVCFFILCGSRMMDLLGTIGLDDRLYSENFDIDKKSDFAKGKAELSLLSNASKKFLNNALSGEI